MNKLKIAFGFQMGAGKGTSAQILREVIGGQILSFATPIYDIMDFAQEKCNLPRQKDRLFLQIIGTEWGRTVKEDIWTDILLDRASTLECNVYVDDLRFPNEMTALQKDGWTCVLVRRNDIDTNRVGNGSSSHISEISLSDDSNWDYIIDNDSTVEELRSKLLKMANILHLRTTSI
jgi:hypothetical protein